jgi:hypothetical protein
LTSAIRQFGTIQMESRIISLLWMAGLAAGQSSSPISYPPSQSQPQSQSPLVVTLSGSQISLTRDYLPGVTLPSFIQGSTIATSFRSSPSGSLRPGNSTTSRASVTEDPVTNIGADKTSTATTTKSAPARPYNTQAPSKTTCAKSSPGSARTPSTS